MIASSSFTTASPQTNSYTNSTSAYTITSSSDVTGSTWEHDWGTVYISSDSSSPASDYIEVFKNAVSARRALFLAWNKEAQRTLFQMTFDKMPFPGRPLGRFCYGRERQRMPIRELFRKRVCGGHQRYRVMRP